MQLQVKDALSLSRVRPHGRSTVDYHRLPRISDEYPGVTTEVSGQPSPSAYALMYVVGEYILVHTEPSQEEVQKQIIYLERQTEDASLAAFRFSAA